MTVCDRRTSGVIFFYLLIHLVFITELHPQNKCFKPVSFKGDASVEIGSRYAGLELHHSLPILQRISFYYPVANSIDLSTDYWKRDTTFIMSIGLKIGDSELREIGKGRYDLELTPYSAKYSNEEFGTGISISYNFAKDKPAFITTYELTNMSGQRKPYEFVTTNYMNLRTCHTFRLKDNPGTESSKDSSDLYFYYDDKETDSTAVFMLNAGEFPLSSSVNKKAGIIKIDNDTFNKVTVAFHYKKILGPGEKLVVIQIMASTGRNECRGTAQYLKKNYKEEVLDYRKYVSKEIAGNTNLNDPVLDYSIYWAKAILAVNRHYIDGSIVPMPCPAEYNFYFTHDLLLTDLATVNFDLMRVKNDLAYVIKHADSSKVIPHAYYWKDGSYKTEYADKDNWNNFWFAIVSAKYLLHSSDKDFLLKLYPYIEKSLDNALRTLGRDSVMWSSRPDWWDIGNKYGASPYMTILAVKALRSFIYISAYLEKNADRLKECENLAGTMEKNLNLKLWDKKSGYPAGYFEDGEKDNHYYMGSLLAAHFGETDSLKNEAMLKRAGTDLLESETGIYNVSPMDFEKLGGFWKFNGNEAGAPFYYINGGIWPHANAFYALALASVERREEAVAFVKKTMTLNGIMNGPNGQPAMYEVRNGNRNEPNSYGHVDKPQFLWAAGFYLYTIYNLFLTEENDWNLQLHPFLPEKHSRSSFDLNVNGTLVKTKVRGHGLFTENITVDKKSYPSLVLSRELKKIKEIKLKIGQPANIYLQSTSSILQDIKYDEKLKRMTIAIKGFKYHRNNTILIASHLPKSINAGLREVEFVSRKLPGNNYEIRFEYTHRSDSAETIEIFY